MSTIWRFLTLMSSKKGYFFLSNYVLQPVKSKSDAFFRRPGPETLRNLEMTNFSRLPFVVRAGRRKWIPDLDFTGQKKKKK